MLAPSLISGVVDAFVTPGAIAAMVQTAEAPDIIGDEDAVTLEPLRTARRTSASATAIAA
ncbi:hypothetical protein [Brevundimonas denitrificans]|uniref:hypothetical protein n=1 Tax=Brevundimonas denitrificans TaxID=1443434 RepID=UPI00223A848B|nr:hypothetical protein [Brevundimonas denitrificans]